MYMCCDKCVAMRVVYLLHRRVAEQREEEAKKRAKDAARLQKVRLVVLEGHALKKFQGKPLTSD